MAAQTGVGLVALAAGLMVVWKADLWVVMLVDTLLFELENCSHQRCIYCQICRLRLREDVKALSIEPPDYLHHSRDYHFLQE